MFTTSSFSARARTHWLTVVLALLLFIPLLFNAAPAQAQPIQIACSTKALEDAIDKRMNTAVDEFILTYNCTYTLSRTLTILADNGAPFTLYAQGSTIHAANAFHAFQIDPGANVTIDMVPLMGGFSSSYGGAIVNNGNLTLSRSVLFQNSAAYGGAIYNSGTLTLNGSIIFDNDADVGGAIYNDGGSITMTNSTIRGNTTTVGDGGAIYNNGGNITMTNSTITGNSAASFGGAIAGSGDLFIRNSTVADNSAAAFGGFSHDSGTLTIHNSIVADNIPDNCDSAGTTSVLYSVIEGGGCSVTNGASGNLTGDPNLAPRDTVEYHALNAGSIAINAGSNSLVPSGLTKDQAGNDRIRGGTVDMGSYEAAPPPSTTTALVSSSNPSVYGQTVTFTATVTAAGTPTGTVEFFDGITSLGIVPLVGVTATYSTSALTVTTHNITAAYSGSPYFSGSTSSTVNQTVNQAPTTTTLTTNPDVSSVSGQTVTLTATVTSSAGTPGGTVTFYDGGTFLGNATLSGGIASTSTSALTVGTHNSITAVYSGDASFATSTSSSESHTVSRANTSTSVSASPNPSVFGQAVTLTAVVTASPPGAGTPTGTITFVVGGTSLAPVALTSGTASLITSNLPVGTPLIEAIYSGDANFSSSQAGVIQTVNKASTTTSVEANPVSSVFGQNVTFTATVAITTPGAGTLSGSVQFFANDTTSLGTVPLSGGTAILNTSGLPAGTPSVKAIYSGDTNFSSSTSSAQSLTVSYANTQTTLSSSPNPAAFGQSVTFTAVVSASSPSTGTPSDWVYFLDGSTQIGSATLSGGTATFSTSVLTAGAHTITARYGGVGGYNQSTSSPLTQTVNHVATTTTVSSTPNPSTYGQAVTLTATVTTAVSGAGAFAGTVSFYDGATLLGSDTIAAGGVATLTTSSLTGGNHSITAVYGGGGNYAGSTAAAHTHTVSANATITNMMLHDPISTVFGQEVTFQAAVMVAPGSVWSLPVPGEVEFFDGTTSLGTFTLGTILAHAVLDTGSLTVGSHSITVQYLGNSNFATSTSPVVTHLVEQASTTTTLSGAPSPSVFGQAVTFTATIAVVAPGAGTPTGSVEFFDGATSLGTGTLSGGTASLTTGALELGSHNITARYLGDGNFATSTSPVVTHLVEQANTTTTLSSAPNPSVFGEAVTFAASVAAAAPGAGTPTGTVEFLDGATLLGTATLAGGTAEFTISALNVGAHTITATYSGDSNYVTSTTTASHVVDQAGTTVSVSSAPNPSSFGEAVTFTASVTAAAPGDGTATGTIEFFDGSTSLGTATLSGGTASLTTSALGLGAHTITAVYSGDGSFTGNTSPNVTQTVGAAATSTTLLSNPNPSYVGDVVTLTATVTASSGTATGTVEFFDGSTSLGTAALVGDSATMTINTLSVGSHSLTAVYSGCPEATTSTSEALSHTVELIPAGTTLASSPNPSYFGDVVTLTATVNVSGGTPTGTIEFFDGSTTLGTATLVGSTATMTTSTLAEGTHSLTAAYSGDETYDASTSPALTHTINPVPIIILNPAALEDGMVDMAYSQLISASGGSGSYTFAVTSGALPAGLTLTATGALSGTPTYAGTASFTVTATDTATTFTGERAYTLVIHSAPPPPPPAPYAEDINFDTEAPVRTGVPETLVDSISLRVLYQNGQPVQWLGGDLYNAGSIGVQGILDLGVQQAVDIFSPNGVTYFNGGAVFCLRGTGPLIWLAASGVPRHAEIIGSYTVPEFPGYTCATLFEPGTLVLVRDLPR